MLASSGDSFCGRLRDGRKMSVGCETCCKKRRAIYLNSTFSMFHVVVSIFYDDVYMATMQSWEKKELLLVLLCGNKFFLLLKRGEREERTKGRMEKKKSFSSGRPIQC